MTTRQAPPSRSGVKKAVIVDDHPIVRQGLAKLLSDERDLALCAEAQGAREALEVISKSQPDLAIVDISLSGKTGLDLLKDLRALYPKLPVLVLSMHDEQIYAERALRAGARGYIMKQEGGKSLLQAIRQVLGGQIYVSEKIARAVLQRLSEGEGRVTRSPVEQLSEREFEVFQLIGQGLGTRQIAEQLHVSAKTVDVHRLRIRKKLQLQTGPALMRYAMSWEPTHAGP